MSLTCHYCEREGAKQFIQVYLGSCIFEGLWKNDFTLVMCSNEAACNKRAAKLKPTSVSLSSGSVGKEKSLKEAIVWGELEEPVLKASASFNTMNTSWQNFNVSGASLMNPEMWTAYDYHVEKPIAWVDYYATTAVQQ